MMKFEWDEAKNESNIRKHEVDFADAVSIFSQTSLTVSFLAEGLTDMSANDTTTTSRTNWERLRTMSDDEIDYSDIPPLTDAFFKRAKVRLPSGVLLDPEVYTWLRQQGGDLSERINEVLRLYMEQQKPAA